jgi:hypothetical protein
MPLATTSKRARVPRNAPALSLPSDRKTRKANSMEQSKIRSWWAHRQSLDSPLAGKPAPEVLQRAGWARSVGGSNPYLTLFSCAGLDRENIDAAVAKMEIHELPSARGRTYLLPASDFALGLTVGQGFGGEMKLFQKRARP